MTTEAPVEQAMPANLEELHDFVTKTFGQLLSNPANIAQLARSLSDTNTRALDALIVDAKRRSNRRVVVRTEYPDSIRAVLNAAPEENVRDGSEPIVVELFARNDSNTWVKLIPETNEQAIRFETLRRLVLSESNIIPGEVYYVTTVADVESLQDAMIDQQLAHSSIAPQSIN